MISVKLFPLEQKNRMSKFVDPFRSPKPMKRPTLNVARLVLNTVDMGLTSGRGFDKPGHMCVEAAVCYAMGLDHSDEPPCVHEIVRSIKIRINDLQGWSDEYDRAQGLRAVAVAQLGSNKLNGNDLIKTFRSRMLTMVVPKVLELSFKDSEIEKASKKIVAEMRKRLVTGKRLRELIEYFNALSKDYAAHRFLNYTLDNVVRALNALANLPYRRNVDHCDVVDNAICALANCPYTGSSAETPEVQLIIAEALLCTLKKLKSPGCKWLHLLKEPR